jgi:DNA-binding response OmpR family regulator
VITRDSGRAAVVLVVEDVEEIRDGIEKLLTTDGYRVDPARSEDDAIDRASRRCPDLILVSLGGSPLKVIARAARIRQRAGIDERVPVVVFCVPTLDQGAEIGIGHNVYVTRPDNFDQLRSFLNRLLVDSIWSN